MSSMITPGRARCARGLGMRAHIARAAIATIVTALLAGRAAAQKEPAPSTSTRDTAVRAVSATHAAILAPTVVSATREVERRNSAPVAIGVVSGAEIARTGPAHPGAVLNRIPGVHIVELSGEGHMTAIRQPMTTKPVYLYLEDGVPVRATGFFNHNALYEVNVPQAGRIEVLKGPGTALYGSDAIGGVINVLSRRPPASPTAELSAEGGSFGWRRLLVSAGNTFGENGAADGLRVDLNLTRSQGWRDASSYRRSSATTRWDHVARGGWIARTVLTGTAVDQHDAYTLDETHFSARSPFNRSPIAFRRVRALRLSSAIETENGPTLWSLTPYARYDDLGLLPYWQLTYDPQIWDTRNTSLGVLAKVRRVIVPGVLRAIAGADADVSPGRYTAARVIPVSAGTGTAWSSYARGESYYDYDVTYRGISPYVQVEFTPVPRAKLDLGARYDLSGYVYHTRLTPDESPGSRHRRPGDTTITYHHLSPKLGLTVDVTPGVNAFIAYRHGFRVPSQGQIFAQGSAANTVGLEPVRVDSYEIGVRGGAWGRLLYELSLYDMTLSNDVLTFTTPQNTREAVNAGKSRYRGIELGVGAQVTPVLRLDASYSASTDRYVHYVPQSARPARDSVPARPAIDYSGRLVEQAPRDLASVILGWSPPALRGGRVAIELDHTGRYAADPANSRWYPGFDVVALRANARVRPAAEVFVRVTNAFNRVYAELVSYNQFQGMQYSPGSPRTLYAGMRYTMER